MKAENKTEDMIDILQHIQQYTPVSPQGKILTIFFGGDQLTRERASSARIAKMQSKDQLKRLQGIIPKSEDWHALVCFYQVQRIQLHDAHSIFVLCVYAPKIIIE